MSAQVIAVSAGEIEALYGAGPLAFQAYMLLRAWMDFGTGIAGRSRPISLAMLRAYCETHTPRGAGIQVTAPSEKEIRTSLARLARAGLVRRLPGDRLAFSLLLALKASARTEQTGHGEGASSSTETGTRKPRDRKGFAAEPDSHRTTPEKANRAHIKNHALLSSSCEFAAYLSSQGIAADEHTGRRQLG